jgi:hypothetical protein
MTISQFAVAILFTAALAAAEDPFVGTWKLDLDKTKLGPGAPASWKTEISVKVEAIVANQHHITSFSPDGKVTGTDDNIFDGQERQDARGRSGRSHKEIRIDERHARLTGKGPKGTSVTDSVVSADGKTLTETMTGTGPGSGRPLEGEVLVWRKQ